MLRNSKKTPTRPGSSPQKRITETDAGRTEQSACPKDADKTPTQLELPLKSTAAKESRDHD